MRRDYLIPLTPVSVNHSYPDRAFKTKGGAVVRRRSASPELVEFKESSRRWLMANDASRGGPPKLQPDAFYRLLIAYLFPAHSTVPVEQKRAFQRKDNGFFFKNGKVRRLDTSNMIKAVEDAVSEYLGVDDAYNIDVRAARRPVTGLQRPVIVVRYDVCNIDDPIFGGDSAEDSWLDGCGAAVRQSVDLVAVRRVLTGGG